MKKTIIVIMILSYVFSMYSQTDTTKVRVGKKKYTIIKNYKDDYDDMESSKKKFESSIVELEKENQSMEDSLKAYNKKLESLESEYEKLKLREIILEKKKSIYENDKKITALNKGIENIDDDLDEMKDEMDNDDWGEGWGSDWIRKKRKRTNRFRGHWAGFNVGLNTFVNKDYNMDLPVGGEFMELQTNKSWYFAINFIELNLPLWSDKIGFVTGLGIENNNYHFKKNINLVESTDGVITGVNQDPNIKDYYKNTLNTFYLTVPFLYEMQFPTAMGRKLFINFGVVGGIKLHSMTKQFYKTGGDRNKDRTSDDFQLSPFTYGFTAKVGIGPLRVFANYSISTLFEKDKGPKLYPFTIGLTILNF